MKEIKVKYADYFCSCDGSAMSFQTRIEELGNLEMPISLKFQNIEELNEFILKCNMSYIEKLYSELNKRCK